jgi:hypothetical protein
MSSPSANHLKQTFSKGPAHNTRSSFAHTCTSKSAPTVPPDPGEHNPLPSTPSNHPSPTSFTNPSLSNIQQSSSPSSNTPFHSAPTTTSPFKSPPHHTNNRFSALENWIQWMNIFITSRQTCS